MIIGGGLMANNCKQIDSDEYVFFASGVSNSREVRFDAFKRERDLLRLVLEDINDRILIYFGTTAESDGRNDAYLSHKADVINMIKASGVKYLILNVSNVIGNGGNKMNLVNHFYDSILNGEMIFVHDHVKRSLIDVDTVMEVLHELLYNHEYGEHTLSQIEPLPVIDILYMIAEELGITPHVTIIPHLPSVLKHNSESVNKILRKYSFNNYTLNTIKKYFSHEI